MAHIVGVPKREPCQKCSLPVFLAERLTIGKNVYHRTCLRCARCNSQLTPGSFYETEIDGEYCCETCPDEEKKLDVASTSKDNKDEQFSQKSIAERLAFFESDGNKVLQKSLSDEEKSQSLKKFNESQLQEVYKPNSALSNFMNSHLSDTVDASSHKASRRSSNGSISSSSSSISNDISEEPPELPKSLPPSSLEVDISGNPSLQPSETLLESSTENSNVIINIMPKDVYSNSSEIKNKKENKLLGSEEPSIAELEQKKDTPVPICNDFNLSINVTKDSSEDDEQMRTKTDPTIVERFKEPTGSSVGIHSTNRSSMVRARLHQFEVIANKSQDSSISSVSKNRLSNFSKTKRTSIDGSSESLETEVPKNVSEYVESHQDSLKLSSSTDRLTNKENENASYTTDKDEKVIEINDIEDNSLVIKDPVSQDSNKEEIEQINLPVDKLNSKAMLLTNSKEVLSDTLPRIEQDSELNVTPILEAQLPVKENNSADITDMSLQKESSKSDEYPEELNPFKSDDEGEEQSFKIAISIKEKRKSLNPFESSDEEDDGDRKQKPPRPPPPKKISTNPFGSESEEEESSLTNTASASTPKKTPIPTPRNYRSTPQNLTPEPIPRITRQSYETPLRNTSDYYGSTSSLSTSGLGAKVGMDQFHRESEVRGSGRSLASSSGSGNVVMKPKKKKAPAPPPPLSKMATEIFSPSESDSKKSSPGSSTATTPTPQRKKRPAPPPPPSTKIETSPNSSMLSSSSGVEHSPDETQDFKLENEMEKLCDEEKALLENNSQKNGTNESYNSTISEGIENSGTARRRLITLDASLVEDANTSEDLKIKEEENVVYRRTITAVVLDDLTLSPASQEGGESHDRQLEKLKDNKEAKNRNRQSQISLHPEENDPLYNKSVHGKWKRRKGPAPALPVPPKKVLQMLPLQEIRHELEIIEVQQQGLEKQGVMLEKMIRERCEGPPNIEGATDNIPNPPNSKEVEDLILQLFELVNEKNELFRRQAELMYLRRQHRLEQEQADLEYEIRVLMAQPERNKTDSDKAREEALIARLVEVVQLRNEVIECLEMDRLREAEEDMSIKQRLEMHSARRDEELSQQTPTKLSKKEKKKQKELKKLGKSKKLDADKDADESELNTEKQKMKKKKKKFLF